MFIERGDGIQYDEFVPVIIEQLKQQNLMLKDLLQKVEELTKASEKYENSNCENTDLLNDELTDRVNNIENDVDAIKEICDYVYKQQPQIERIKYHDCEVAELSHRLSVQEANHNDMKLKYQDVKVKHDRLERHAVDHWGYRF